MWYFTSTIFDILWKSWHHIRVNIYEWRIIKSRDAILHFIKICGHPTTPIWTQSSDYKIWGVLQERIYKTSINDVDELRRRIADEWDKPDQRRIILLIKQLESGERDFQRVWLLVKDSLNTRCEH